MSPVDIRDDTPVYLKAGSKLEPLLSRWPVWPHLIAPAQHAMNLAFRQLPNLQSFVAGPSVHVAAAKDPAMLGGPFVCLELSDVERAQTLLKETQHECAHLIRFANDLRDLDGKLQSAARGGNLDAFYAQVPASLAGLLELTYDLNSHPRIRLLEELLYEGGLDNRGGEELCLHRIADDQRPFFMSTPLLDAPDRVFLKLPFEDSRVDELAALRYEPRPLGEITQRLGLDEDNARVFRTFVTTEAPTRNAPNFPGGGLRVRYFGHACVLLQTDRVSVLIDPLTAWERNEDEATLTFDDLPDRIDYVVISHTHQDHFVPEMLMQLRGRVGEVVVPRNSCGNLADPSLRLMLKSLGYDRIRVMDAMESIGIPDGEILSLPFLGEHAGLDISSKQCVSIRLAGRTFLFLVDADAVDAALYRRVAARIGKVDALFIGMECFGAPLTWLYGPLLTRAVTRRDDEARRLSGSTCDRAWNVVKEIGCDRAYIYGMGQERWLSYLLGLRYTPESIQMIESGRFLEKCSDAGIAGTRLHGCCDVAL